MSKKILSVLLAVVLVITAAFGGMTVSAEGLTNYVGDGGFENADFSGTILNFGQGGATETQTWGRFSSGVTRMELVTSADYSGDDSVALNGNKYMKSGVTADGNYIRGFGQRLELTAGDYVLTFIAKSDASNTFKVGVFSSDAKTTSDPDIVATLLDASNVWKEYTLEFTVETDGIYHLIIGGNTGGNGNIRLFYMDNVAVYSKNESVFVDANATVGGTVTGGGAVAKGETVTLTATAKSGYKFAGWADGEANATRTVTATADASYTANFEKISADFVPNGDFEADDWALSDYWTTLSGNNAFVEVADPDDATNTVAYAKGGSAATTLLSKDTVTLKNGHTYYIGFNSYMAEAVSGNGTSYYRVGFLKPGSANLGGASFYDSSYSSVYNNTTTSYHGTWLNGYGYKYTHSGDDAEANIVLGMYNNECTSDWYVDNIVAYDMADLCEMTVTADKGGMVKGAKSAYFTGEEITLTAVAKSGFEFAGWSDGVTDATRTVTATAGATYNAEFTRKLTANLVIDGDFEADDWTVAEAWNTVHSTDKTFTKATEGNNTYAVTTPETRRSLASDVITVEPGETYTLTFDSMLIDSGAELTGDQNGFYRYGFIEASQTNLSGGAFTALAGNSHQAYTPAKMEDARFGVWEKAIQTYTNTGDTAVDVKAVIGYYDASCGYEWRVDNVILYNGSDVITVKAWAQNGSVSNGSVTALKGETVTITASPSATDSKFVGWFVSGSTEVISTDETLTVTATEDITYYAQYAYVGKNLVVNGDFESTGTNEINLAANLTSSPLENMWGKVGTGVNMFAQTDITEADDTYVNGAKYVTATVPEAGYVRSFGQYVTLEPGTEYVLEFIAKNNTNVNIYAGIMGRYTSGNPAMDPNWAITYTTIPTGASDWTVYTLSFNSGDTTSACVAFGGNTTDTAGNYFAIDNVVLSKASDYGIGKTVVSDFENGTDGWTASEGATVTTAAIADTALKSFSKYLGSTVGVITPAAEGDTFTSPAFATEAGKTYDVVIYTRHNSADDTRGTFAFTAGGSNESMKYASYGAPGDDSQLGIYENDNGFKLIPDNANKDAYTSATFVKLIFTFTATAETHNVTITTVTPVSAFVDGFEVYSHEASVELAQNSIGFKGTAIRTTGVQGLRFKSSMDLDALKNFGNYAKVVEYGTLAIKEEYKKGALTVENLTDGTYEYTKSSGTVGCRLKVGVAYSADNGTDVVYASNAYVKDFTGVLIGIDEDNYSSNFVTRVYAKVQFADGTYVYVYGDEQVANVKDVAQYIVDNSLESEEVREYLNTNILNK